jgi:hypothetical protein
MQRSPSSSVGRRGPKIQKKEKSRTVLKQPFGSGARFASTAPNGTARAARLFFFLDFWFPGLGFVLKHAGSLSQEPNAKWTRRLQSLFKWVQNGDF